MRQTQLCRLEVGRRMRLFSDRCWECRECEPFGVDMALGAEGARR
jgi:hypothetical protein